MKMRLTVPAALLLAGAAVACGKTSGPVPASVGNPVVANAAPVSPAQAALSEPSVVSDLQAFCQANLGTMTADQLLCKFDMDYNYGKSRIIGFWTSPVYVVQNDTLDIRSSGAPVPVIGSNEYRAGSTHLVAPQSGNLAFRGQGSFLAYSVGQIHIKRCFSSRSTTVACPSE